jgi:hypothetical protein
MIETAQRPLQPQSIPAMQNPDDIGLVALYESLAHLLRRKVESLSHDFPLHNKQFSVTLVAALPRCALGGEKIT